MLAGFVAGEGWFSSTDRGIPFRATGAPRRRFRFGVMVAARDLALLEMLRAVLGCGAIDVVERSAPAHWQPIVGFRVDGERDLLHHVVPFMERYLLPCAKRRQFEAWRDELTSYVEARPSQWRRGPSTCSVEGCERPVRGRGLCRSHYYRVTGY
jgi:hypothetical protein